MIGYFNGYVLYPFLEKATKRKIAPKLNELRVFESLSPMRRAEIQREAAYELVRFCKSEVPYYRDLFQAQRFDVEKVRGDIRYLQELPVLTKDIVREQGTLLQGQNRAPYHARKTGGSTGQSVYFFYDNEGLDWTAAINLRAYEMTGKRPHHSDTHISADLDFGKPPFSAKLVENIRFASQNRRRLMVSAFTDELLERAYRELKRRSPYLLQGHPSSAYAIAGYIERNGIAPARLCHVFEPSGEMLTPKMVETIEKNLLCRVFNRYGNAEFGVVAHSREQDPYTKLKVFERAFWVEPCDQGQIIATALTNFGFPLLRYDTGDVATVKDEDDGRFILDIQGRIHDRVTIAGEEFPTHYIMDYLDHRIRRIREFQIVLEKDSQEPVLNVVLEEPGDEARVRDLLEKRWPKGLRIRFISYDQLSRVGWQQKFRHIIDLRKT